MFLTKLNPVEPPWYVTRMPGGVGGVAPRGVPLSRLQVPPPGVRRWNSSVRAASLTKRLSTGSNQDDHDTRFPLGLGTFEAACVGMLILLGIAIEADVIG